MKKIILTAAIALAVASPAMAASTHHSRHAVSADETYASADMNNAPELEGQGRYAIDRDTVVFGDEVLGRDPDAFIRQQLLRVGNTNDVGGF